MLTLQSPGSAQCDSLVGEEVRNQSGCEAALASRGSLRILLIDDDLAFQRIIRYRLTQGFQESVEVTCVVRVEEGAALLRENAIHKFTLVITDLGLPDSDGLDTYRRVREATDIPVIILTGHGDSETVRSALREGADEVLLKDNLTEHPLSRAVSFVLEKSARRHAEKELSAAKEIQRSLYPSSGLSLPGLDIAGQAYPAEATSGDYFDFIPLAKQQIGLVVGDVSGHGLGPALMAMQARAYLRSLADMSEFLDWNDEPMEPGEILTHLNRQLTQSDGTRFLTMFLGQIDPWKKILEYAAAGHQAYLFHESGELETLPSTGGVLGMMAGIAIPASSTITLEPGDLLFVPTDGIEEAMSKAGEPFGRERMFEELLSVRHLSADEMVKHVRSSAREFCGNVPQHDDMTAVVLKVS